MSRTVNIACPFCDDAHDLKGTVTHEPGYWRDHNGDGLPESWEVDFEPTECPTTGKEFPASLTEEFILVYTEAEVQDSYPDEPPDYEADR